MSTARGFTLIELLVAVSLATIITLLGVSMMRTSINSSVANEEALVQSQAIRDARRLIEYAWAGRLPTRFAAEGEQVEFLSGQTALGPLPLRFSCRRAENGEVALWLRRPLVPTGEAPAESRSTEEVDDRLLGGLRACRFSFLRAPQGDKLPAQWTDEWTADLPPPAVIRLDLESARGALPPFIFAYTETS